MSTPATAPIKQRKQPVERPSWVVLGRGGKAHFFSDFKLATRTCRRRVPNARPPYALRLIFADELLGSCTESSAFQVAIPPGTFNDSGFFSCDGDFEDELARYLEIGDDGRPGPRGVDQIESGRIYLADNTVCERLNLDEGAWPIHAILARASELPGHDSDFIHPSYDELAYQIASDVVMACREVMPGISRGAMAAFCLSFQVDAHLQDRFRRFGRTSTAKRLAGQLGNPGRLAESAMYSAKRLLQKYARVLGREAARAPAGPIVTPVPADTSGVIKGWQPTILVNERAPAARAPAPPAPDLDGVAQCRPDQNFGVAKVATSPVSPAGEDRSDAVRRGRPAIENGRRNRAIVRVAEAIPNWKNNLSDVAEALDASAEPPKPPRGAPTWVDYYCSPAASRHFRKKIQDAFDWCSRQPINRAAH